MNETRVSKPVKWTLSETYSMNDRLFERLQSRPNTAERTFHRCLADLKRLQSARLLRSETQSGFDPSRDRQGAVLISTQTEEPKHKTPKSALFRNDISESPSPLPDHRPIAPTRAPSPLQAREPVTNL
jgi:hypothetical protein